MAIPKRIARRFSAACLLVAGQAAAAPVIAAGNVVQIGDYAFFIGSVPMLRL